MQPSPERKYKRLTDDDLKEMLVLPPGMIFKDMRKFRAALAEALVPESKNVTCLEPNPFLYSESDTMWSKKEDNDDNPSYDQFIEHYTIADPKPQLLKSIFGLQKGPKKSTSNLPAENYNDPTQYSTHPLVNENEKLKRQIESAQLLKLNKELTKQLQNLNDSSHSNKHHKKSTTAFTPTTVIRLKVVADTNIVVNVSTKRQVAHLTVRKKIREEENHTRTARNLPL
jgi:hypothetical protein